MLMQLMRKYLSLTLAGAGLLLAFNHPAALAAPYTISSDGTEVTDHKTGLIWRRCAEGLSGAECATGSATPATWDEALELAKMAALSSGLPWRLPNVKELSSIVELGTSNPAIDRAAFPGTPPASWFWSSTPQAGTAEHAWYVNFGYGGVNDYGRKFTSLVRLVRLAK